MPNGYYDAPCQRAEPVVLPEGLSAGGGVLSTTVDPGVPLGPGLLSTWRVLHGPHVRTTNRRTKPATTMASVLLFIWPL